MKKLSFTMTFRQITLFIFLLGIMLGCIIGISKRSSYITEFTTFQSNFQSRIAGYSFNNFSVMCIALMRNLKYMLFILFFSFTSFYTPFLTFMLFFCGTYFGMLFSAHIISSGINGLATIVAYLFPQIFLLLPVYYILLKCGYTLSHPEFHEKKGQLLLSQLPKLFLLLCLLILAGFLEGYVNIPFLKMMLTR